MNGPFANIDNITLHVLAKKRQQNTFVLVYHIDFPALCYLSCALVTFLPRLELDHVFVVTITIEQTTSFGRGSVRLLEATADCCSAHRRRVSGVAVAAVESLFEVRREKLQPSTCIQSHV
jgi:hypothetical protein